MIRAMLRLFTLRRRRWRELFSLAIDERLSDAEAAELERILDRSQEARKEFEEMKASVTALRAAPQVEPTRSFRLTPDMVEAPAPEPVRRLPAFVPAAAGAAALLVFAIIGGTLGLFGGGPSGQESLPLAAAPPDVTAAPAPTAESLARYGDGTNGGACRSDTCAGGHAASRHRDAGGDAGAYAGADDDGRYLPCRLRPLPARPPRRRRRRA